MSMKNSPCRCHLSESACVRTGKIVPFMMCFLSRLTACCTRQLFVIFVQIDHRHLRHATLCVLVPFALHCASRLSAPATSCAVDGCLVCGHLGVIESVCCFLPGVGPNAHSAPSLPRSATVWSRVRLACTTGAGAGATAAWLRTCVAAAPFLLQLL